MSARKQKKQKKEKKKDKQDKFVPGGPGPFKDQEFDPDVVYPVYVWQFPVRFYHWFNVTMILILGFLGTVMYNKPYLGITDPVAGVTLKKIHVLCGYLFMFNNYFRVVWGFIGNKYACWLYNIPNPFAIAAFMKDKEKKQYAGHDPILQLMTFLFLSLIFTIGGTGYFRAASDLFYPPLGPFVQDYLAAKGVRGWTLEAGNMTGVDPEAFEMMNWGKEWIGTIHRWAVVSLFSLVVVHVFYVVRKEKTQGGAIVSAMWTGNKHLKGKNIVDLPDRPEAEKYDQYGGLIDPKTD